MKKKWILSLLLLGTSGVLFATLWPEKPQAGTFVNAEGKLAADAETFTRELLELARKNDRKNFAARCHDTGNRDLPAQFATMRDTRLAGESSWQVEKIKQQEDFYLVRVKTSDSDSYRCALARNPEKNEWKFLGLYDE